jgi:hypothetical protein
MVGVLDRVWKHEPPELRKKNSKIPQNPAGQVELCWATFNAV